MNRRSSHTTTPCRACRTPKPSGLYLCPNCWAQLPPAAQRLLNARGDRARALARLRQLHAHIDAERPLRELEITT